MNDYYFIKKYEREEKHKRENRSQVQFLKI